MVKKGCRIHTPYTTDNNEFSTTLATEAGQNALKPE